METSNEANRLARPGSSRSPRTALLVLGMHRSGTSALARMLSLLGAALPEHIMGAYRGNEAGHWEPERLVNLHDEMLTEAGSRWDDWRRFDPTALGPERLDHYKSEIARLISEEYEDASLFVLKDPRLCRFVPLYEEVLSGMGVEPRYVLTHRNPVSVLDSLAARDDMSAPYASLVWLRHVLDAEEATRGKARLLLAYEEYLEDWRAATGKISSALDLDWPRDVDEAGQEIESHLSRGLQHHAATTDSLAADPRVGPAVRDAYGALRSLAADEGDEAATETLSRVRAEFESGEPAALGVDVDDWRAIAAHIFEEMAVRQSRDRRQREHLQRLAAKYQSELQGARAQGAMRESARKQLSEDNRALGRQLAAQIKKAEVQATRAGRIASERDGIQSRYATSRAEHAKLTERNEALKEQNKTLKDQSKSLEAGLAASRGSTSWKLTLPVRAARRLTADPRGTIAFLRERGFPRFQRARGPNAPVQPAPPPASAPAAPAISVTEAPLAAGPPPTPAKRKPLPGMERLSPEKAARVEAAFDADFYYEQYPDIAAGADPFEHYMLSGWKEGRDPSPAFSTSYYLERYPGIAQAGINPFVHWVSYGTNEKRLALPFRRRLELLDYAPRVSAIVPNYNHARFLGQRLDSILAQTYENIEILILDDCSTDDSRAVIEGYREKYPGRIRTLYNEENSGNVFRQWRKGIENSTGELVWICESDDFCEPDFLEHLVKNFKDRSVNIAFGRIQFSHEDGSFRQGLDQYRENAEPGIWSAPRTRPARRWFAGGFGVNNVIANVGGCIFRRQLLPEAVWDEAANYSTLGDWFLYCHLAGGGQISYEPSAVAYFRLHDSNTSVASYVTPGYYEEHERLMSLLRQRWGVPDETVEAFYRKVVFQYVHHGLEEKLGPIESYCDKQKLLAQERTRLHVLIAFLGFYSGGGEVFPIHLANALHAQGHLVSMLGLDMSEVNREMYDTLDSSIPVYDSGWAEEYDADRFLEEAGVSIIHSHSIPLEAFFFERCRIKKIPYLVTLHGSYEATPPGNERLMRFVLGVTHFVYTADKNLEPFSELPLVDEIFTKLGNGMPEDPRPFPKTRQELGIAEDAVVFTFVARGIQRKGWRVSIAAFLRLREAHPDRKMHLLLCGDGEETDRHSALHGDDPDITFLGYQSRINGLYRQSDVAIVPTRFAGESFPLIVVQALQTGTPAIATRIGEIESMIEGTEGPAGILIDYERDTDLFAGSLQEAMAAMLDASRREEYALAAKKKSRTYSMDKVAQDYTKLYEKMLTETAIER